MKRLSCRHRLAVTTALAMLPISAAHAAGTVAGTSVNNNATVQFSVGGVAQSPVNSNTASFLVDRRVNLVVAEDSNLTTTVTPGATNQVTKFILTNSTNDTLDFSLAAAQDAGGTAAHGGTDNFDASNVRIFVDNPLAGTVGSFDAADTLTYVDELAPDTSRAIFVVVDIPGGQADGSVAGVTLTAAAAAGGTAATQGADLVESPTNTAGVDTVFDDGAGDTDAVRDGKSSDDDDYTVTSATIALVKISKIISDPVRGASNPLAVPGALIEYCVEIANSGSAAATNITFSDTLPGETSWALSPNQNFRIGGGVSGGVCDDTGTVEDDDAVGAGDAGSISGNMVSASVASVPASTSATVKFRVTVN